MVIDRIKKPSQEYWKVNASTETKGDKKREQKQAQDQEAGKRDSFGESSDFIQLFSKDPRKFKTEKIATSEIKGFTFRGVSTHREKALLEVDISFADGTLIRGAQVALNRHEGMKLISRKPGEVLVLDSLMRGSFLTVALPQAGSEKRSVGPIEKVVPAVEEAEVPGLAWYYYLGGGAFLLGIILLIYIFLMV